jgi:hypothetical protein
MRLRRGRRDSQECGSEQCGGEFHDHSPWAETFGGLLLLLKSNPGAKSSALGQDIVSHGSQQVDVRDTISCP